MINPTHNPRTSPLTDAEMAEVVAEYGDVGDLEVLVGKVLALDPSDKSEKAFCLWYHAHRRLLDLMYNTPGLSDDDMKKNNGFFMSTMIDGGTNGFAWLQSTGERLSDDELAAMKGKQARAYAGWMALKAKS